MSTISTKVASSYEFSLAKLSLYISNKNNKYLILSIRGLIDFNGNFNGCIEKRDEIAKNLSQVFPNAKKSEGNYVDSYDNTIVDGVYFNFDSGGESKVVCYDYEETVQIKNNWMDNLSVAIQYEEIASWLEDY